MKTKLLPFLWGPGLPIQLNLTRFPGTVQWPTPEDQSFPDYLSFVISDMLGSSQPPGNPFLAPQAPEHMWPIFTLTYT